MSSGPPVRRRGCFPLILTGVSLLVIVVVVVLILANGVPTIHDPPSADDPVAIEVSNVFEQNFASEVTRVRPDQEPWGVRVREADLNAWLWTRLPAWVAHTAGTSAFGAEPMLQAHISPDRIRLSTDSFVIAFEARVLEQRVKIRPAAGSSIGRLPLPSVVFDRFIESMPLSRLGESLVEGSLGESDPEAEAGDLPNRFELHDGRRIELLEIQLDEGEVVLVFRTLGPDSKHP